jgi:hypothetical protein
MTMTNRYIFAIFFLAINLLAMAQGLRIAIINDVHLNMTDSDVPNDLGNYGQDSTMALFDLMIDDLNKQYN